MNMEVQHVNIYAANTVLRGKFRVINTYIKKKKDIK